jgi:hypothetical protein
VLTGRRRPCLGRWRVLFASWPAVVVVLFVGLTHLRRGTEVSDWAHRLKSMCASAGRRGGRARGCLATRSHASAGLSSGIGRRYMVLLRGNDGWWSRRRSRAIAFDNRSRLSSPDVGRRALVSIMRVLFFVNVACAWRSPTVRHMRAHPTWLRPTRRSTTAIVSVSASPGETGAASVRVRASGVVHVRAYPAGIAHVRASPAGITPARAVTTVASNEHRVRRFRASFTLGFRRRVVEVGLSPAPAA